MIYFTKQEKSFICFLAVVIFIGLLCQYIFKRYPHLDRLINLVESPRLYPKLNINLATKEELIAIPYIGEYTASVIIDRRTQVGPFTSVEQLKDLPGIYEKSYQKFSIHLEVK